MDEVIAKFKTPESCEQFALNVEATQPERALEARRRAVELRAEQHGATTVAEKESLEAIYAYERTLFKKHGRNVKASYTWRKVNKDGSDGEMRCVLTSRRPTASNPEAQPGTEESDAL